MNVTQNKYNCEHIHKNIRLLRQINGYSQRKVAGDFGFAHTTYGHLETGRIVPSLDILYKLSKYYNIRLDYLVCFDFTELILSFLSHDDDSISSDNFISGYIKLSRGGQIQISELMTKYINREVDFHLFPWEDD